MKNNFGRYALIWILLIATIYVGDQFIRGTFLTADDPRAVTPRGSLAESEQSTINLFENVAPSVVYIFTSNGGPQGGGAGSGFVWDRAGHVVTNHHVIAKAEKVFVSLNDGRSTEAKLVGSDPDTDLAVLKIELDNLPRIKIADLNKLNIGDVALAIGYPFRIGQTVTQGIISATGRNQVSQNTYENFLQTDAAINPGNSGGALVNSNGEIIGINSLIYTETGNFAGIGFAIPIDLVSDVMRQITENGYVIRGWLGVEGQNVPQQMLQSINLEIQGVLITGIDIDGPGDKAGLRVGDIITHINRKKIEDTADVLDLVAAGRPGHKFRIEGLRERQSFSAVAVLGQRPMRSR